MCGFSIVKVDSDADGRVDLDDLERKLSDKTAALMLTNPNTLGVFESNIVEIASRVHKAGGLLYYDGANLNAICGKARPGDMGFDVVHLNVHKTFGTPHGGGGPGGGPVGVKAGLADYLPLPDIGKTDDDFYHWITDGADSIGRVGSFYGNVRVYVLAYAYILRCGGNGLADVAERAALNANYLRAALKDRFPVAYPTPTFHEFVCAPSDAMLAAGVHTLDIAKRLIDFGYHPMTIYFPLIVKEAMMIEPTETESKETLDAFINVMLKIADEIQTTPDIVKNAPNAAPIRRVDEVKAAKDLCLTYRRPESN
jgi:glycine dehydrogenase subunit 2